MGELRKNLASVPAAARGEVLSELSEDIILKLQHEPYFLLRPKQLVPFQESHDTYLLNAGRGFGKNFTGAHWIVEQARERPGADMALIGESAADVRDYMVEGPSGVLNVGPPGYRPEYEPSKRRLTFPSGATATTYSADKPDQLRGFSGEVVWWDEAAKARFAAEVQDQIDYVLREGEHPELLVTTTPRPIPTIKEMVEDEAVRVITGSSFENRQHLADRFLRKLEEAEDTRLGKQEVHAHILDAAGDLWDYDDIEHVTPDEVPELVRIVIGLDPSVSDSEGDECGIVVVGMDADETAYVLEDLSGQYTTQQWGAVVTAAYQGRLEAINDLLGDTQDLQRLIDRPYEWPPADAVHAERNQGGGLVESQIRTFSKALAYDSTHTSRSKRVRAEPVHALYQMGKVKHVGSFAASPDDEIDAGLEDQMTDFLQTEDSPDRVDALVYAVDELLLDEGPSRDITSYSL